MAVSYLGCLTPAVILIELKAGREVKDGVE
jgi:hypothetical protein